MWCKLTVKKNQKKIFTVCSLLRGLFASSTASFMKHKIFPKTKISLNPFRLLIRIFIRPQPPIVQQALVNLDSEVVRYHHLRNVALAPELQMVELLGTTEELLLQDVLVM